MQQRPLLRVSCFVDRRGDSARQPSWKETGVHVGSIERAKRVAADFSKRRTITSAGEKFDRKRARSPGTVVDGQAAVTKKPGKEKDRGTDERNEASWTEGRGSGKEREKEREREREEVGGTRLKTKKKKKRYRLAVDEEIGIHG